MDQYTPGNSIHDLPDQDQAPATDHDYAKLSPDWVIDAIESLGFLSDLRVFALNSYENRVYQIGIEGENPVIAKFYRPERWSDRQILEEHEFSLALDALEIPVIPPLVIEGKSLFEFKGFRFALYQRRGGYAPELEDLDCLFTLGQHMGRIHAAGATTAFKYRPSIDIDSYAINSRKFILENNFIPRSLIDAYKAASDILIETLTTQMNQVNFQSIRIHGDCHPGNILSRPDSLYIVDLDDARNGPAIQDIWMLLSGDLQMRRSQLSSILDGYEEFYEFNLAELKLIEPLRALRQIHYAGWLAKRWQDPAFPMAFPWFNTERYWAEHILEMKEQISILSEPTLTLQ